MFKPRESGFVCGIQVDPQHPLNGVTVVDRGPGFYRFGSVGKVLPGSSVQISDGGQVLVEGPGVFSGYYGSSADHGRDAEEAYCTGDCGYFDEDGFLYLRGRLSDFIKLTWTNGWVPGSLFRAETFHDLADFLDDVALCDPGQLQYYGGHIINTLSHGEGILGYFRGRYQIPGLYLLDEPEAALSPNSQIEFLRLLQDLEPRGHAQFIITTHSPILLGHPGAQIFSFDGPRIHEITYEDTTHYRLYRQFLIDRDAFLSLPTAPLGQRKE